MMAVRYRHCVYLRFPSQVKQWQAPASLVSRVASSVKKETMPVDFDEPRAGADVIGWVKVRDPHDVLNKNCM